MKSEAKAETDAAATGCSDGLSGWRQRRTLEGSAYPEVYFEPMVVVGEGV